MDTKHTAPASLLVRRCFFVFKFIGIQETSEENAKHFSSLSLVFAGNPSTLRAAAGIKALLNRSAHKLKLRSKCDRRIASSFFENSLTCDLLLVFAKCCAKSQGLLMPAAARVYRAILFIALCPRVRLCQGNLLRLLCNNPGRGHCL